MSEADTAVGQPDPPAPAPRWVGPSFIVLAALTVPWIGVLAVTLPKHQYTGHYRMAWVGFDVLLVIMLARTGRVALRGRDSVQIPAVMTGTLLVVDAWFDVMTSHGQGQMLSAFGSALFIELPLAALCFWIARHAERVRRDRLRWALRGDGVDFDRAPLSAQ
ncbi:MAG TPA: hypothetical protein VIM19_08175 [Actinomycetes bacterium]